MFLIHWNQAEAHSRAEALRQHGWQVAVETEDGQRACRRILDDLPLAVVIHLSRLPSHGRVTGAYLRTQPAGRSLPILFVDGSDEAQRKALEKVEGAICVPQESLQDALADLADAS